MNNSGSVGVMLFFVLSGFLMAYLYLERRPLPWEIVDYVRNRFARIYPLFAVVVLTSALLYNFVSDSFIFKMDGTALVEHLLLFGRGLTLWTISVEFQFYAIFLLIWLAYAALGRRRDLILTVSIVVSMGVLALTGFNEDRIAINGYLHVFLAGILVWQVSRTRYAAWLKPIASPLLTVLLVAFCASLYFLTKAIGGREVYNVFWLLAGISLIVLTAIVAPDSLVSRFLASAPMMFLGELSFGIYLLHRPVTWVTSHFVEPGWGQFALVVLGTIALSYVSWRLIECPARAAIKAIALPWGTRELPR